eukprot:m.53414 g.53414  ORF g.53414 m.53414 type:complete len:492 (+) comp6481_c0_seq1:31-1506(+)
MAAPTPAACAEMDRPTPDLAHGIAHLREAEARPVTNGCDRFDVVTVGGITELPCSLHRTDADPSVPAISSPGTDEHIARSPAAQEASPRRDSESEEATTTPDNSPAGTLDTTGLRWTCSVCGFANSIALAVCAMCDAPIETADDEAPTSPKLSASADQAPIAPTSLSALAGETASAIAAAHMQDSMRDSRADSSIEGARSNPFLEELPELPVLSPTRHLSGSKKSWEGHLASFIPPADREVSKNPGIVMRAKPASGTYTYRPPSRRVSLAANAAQLLCEGYLFKLRGTVMNKKRWFVLTTTEFKYLDDNAGTLIARVALEDIDDVIDLVGSARFHVSTKCAFGQSQRSEMLLRSASIESKQKWLNAFLLASSIRDGQIVPADELLTEGYITKVQSTAGGISNTHRWFRLTRSQLSYARSEAGDVMGATPIADIVQVTILRTKLDFTVSSAKAFTASGSFEVWCRCSSELVRAKWLMALAKLLPKEKIITPS